MTGPGRPAKKPSMSSFQLRHLVLIQEPIDAVGVDGTPLAKASDPADSANWTTVGRAFCSFKEIQGRLYLDRTAYSDQRVTLRHADAQEISQRVRLIRDDGLIFSVQTIAIDLDDRSQWCEVLAQRVVVTA